MLVLLIVHLLFLLCSNPGSCNISTASLAGVWTQCVCWLFGLVGALLCVSLYFDIRKIALSISVVFVVFIVQLWWSCLVHGGSFAHLPFRLVTNACAYVCRILLCSKYRYTSILYIYIYTYFAILFTGYSEYSTADK